MNSTLASLVLSTSALIAPAACGQEVSLAGYATQLQKTPPFQEVSHLAFGARVAVDADTDLGNRDQWRASFAPLRKTDGIGYGFLGVGYSVGAVSSNENWFASIGSELRVEKIKVDPTSTRSFEGSSILVRPWAVATVGFKGLLIPLPGFEIANYYATRSNRVYPFTRLELAYPVIKAGGSGLGGALSRTANAPQISIQLGVHF